MRHRHTRITQRLIDIAVSAAGLVLASPVMLLTAIAIRVSMGKPVLFRQVRPGLGGRPFVLLKFRTMTCLTDAQGADLPDGMRLTPLGRCLRRASLDELPEFWNVLRGDMSLVGPRPLLMKYLPFYTEEERIRFMVRPGITGWAQVNGRNEASWDDRLRNDIWYVRNQSFLLDMKILWMTVAKVLRREQVIVDARSVMLNLDEERAGLKLDRV